METCLLVCLTAVCMDEFPLMAWCAGCLSHWTGAAVLRSGGLVRSRTKSA